MDAHCNGLARGSWSVVSFTMQRPDRVVVLGNKTAVGILDGSQRLATKVVAGAQTLGEHVRSGSQYLKARIKPADQPVQLSAVTKTRVHSAKMVSGAAVKGKLWHSSLDRELHRRDRFHLCSC